MRTIDVDVFVVGAGPTGLALAALLARDGVQVTAITRYSGLANSPHAHIINQRTMEVFRDLGIEQRVTDAAMPASLMGQVVWAESFAGPEIARRRGWGEASVRLGVPLDVVGIGPGREIEDPYLEWAAVREIAEDGCLLIRPDRHIAFRAATIPDDPRAALATALNGAIGRRPEAAALNLS